MCVNVETRASFSAHVGIESYCVSVPPRAINSDNRVVIFPNSLGLVFPVVAV